MRKTFAAIMLVLLFSLNGCGDKVEKLNCYECGDLVDRWIDTANLEPVCARCFAEDGYQICLSCGLAYEPGWSGENGYCENCGETVPPFTENDVQTSYDTGYADGYADGGYEDGYEAGHDAGYTEGYGTGYQDGLKEGKASVSTAASSSGTSASVSSSGTSSKNSSASSGTQQSVTVYITKTGEKYHRSGCQYLKKSKIAISLSDAKARGYTACSRCW